MKNLVRTIILSFVFFTSCEINQKDTQPTDNFVKIYNNPDESLTYYPLSVIQLTDGYLILNGLDNNNNLSDYHLSALIRTNELGEVLWSKENEWLAPAGKLVEFDGSIGYVANNSNRDGYFVKVNLQTGDVETEALGVYGALAGHVNTDGNLVVLGYNHSSVSTEVSVFDPDLTKISTFAFPIKSSIVPEILGHFKNNGTIYPFFIGDWNNENINGFFVNCLNDYSIVTMFFNNTGGYTGGKINSYLITDMVSSLLHKEGNSFALTRFFNNQNYLNSQLEIDVESSQNFNELTDNPLLELVPNARVSPLLASFDNANYMLFASTTNSNSIIIYQYNMDEADLLHTVEVGFTDKIVISQVIQDPTDSGVVILGQLFVAGKYLRPALIKIPPTDFER